MRANGSLPHGATLTPRNEANMADTLDDLKGNNIIDSRDIIARLEELQDEADTLESELSELKEADEPDQEAIEAAEAALVEFAESDENAELKTLKKIAAEGEGYGDWSHGETLIAESHFQEYAQDLAEDIGAIDKNAGWPSRHIDWEAAADELKTDYMEIDLDGETYLMRA